jgi:membrane peptidoglycan carboxypeptidase
MSTSTGRNRRSKNTITTKSGNSIKINRSLSDRSKARKAARSAEKAAYLSTLPKDRWKRLLYRMHPKRVAKYWFSQEGGIMALKIIGASIVVGFFITIGLFAYLRKDLPNIKDISGDNLGGSVTYYDSTGQTVLWQDYNNVKRVGVQSDQISPYMKEATVAIEDKGFYKEGAFDIRGIMRAAVADALKSGGVVQGGSTITQQLVKLNENWTDNRTVTRKVKELILSVELERQYSKNDILTGYLNIAPYGGVDYGVQAAAEDYFQTSAKDLTLPEAAMLAAMPQSPSYYSPYGSTQFNPEAGNTFNQGALLGRQQYILNQMAKQGYITQAQADAAKQVNVLALVHPIQSKYQNIQAPYFVLAAKQQLEQTYGANIVERGGWKVITTLNSVLQAKDEQLIASNFSNVQRRTAKLADEEANVTENVQTGQIVALVGGVDFNNPDYGNINYAATSLIAPGSSFKPYDYVTLINDNNNVGAGSVLYDTEGPLPGYPCTNHTLPPPKGQGNCLADYDFLQPGPLTLRYAMGGSRNIPAEKAMMEAVPNDTYPYAKSDQKVVDTASAMMDNTYLQSKHQSAYNCYKPGVDINNATPADIYPCYNSAAIGDGAFLHLDDHVNGLATLARLGQAIPRTFILKIIDASNQTLYQWKQPVPTQAVKADAAYIVDNMASDPNASYLPGSCSATTCSLNPTGGYKFQRYNGWDFAVKTGTTNSGFDGLMTSWSTQYATVSWVGNHTRNVDISSITGTPMEQLTEPLTLGMMEAAHAGLKPVNWTQPSDIKVAPAFVVRNHVHYGDIEPSPSNDIFPSWYVGGGSGKATSQTLDKVSGALATSCTPALAKEVVGNANVASWNIDIFVNHGVPNVGSSSSGTSVSSSTATDSVHNCNDSPPTVTLTAPGACTNSCTITATVTQGTHPLSDPQYSQFPGTIKFTLGGQTLSTQTVSNSPSTVSFTYTPTSSGSGTITATVTDSVLYSGSDSAPINFTAASPITLAASTAPHTLNLTWSGATGTVTANISGQTYPSCTNVGGTNCSVTLSPGQYTVFVQDSNGNKSDPPSQVTISGP